MKLNQIKNITIYVMSLLYIIVGIKHFIDMEYFIAIIPPLIRYKKEVVLLSGLIEIVLGLFLLFEKTRKIGSLGIIILLFAVFPANIYLYISAIPREIIDISKRQALIRMPFQIPLIIIAYWHSKEQHTQRFSTICILLFIPTIIYFLTI